MQQSFVTTAIAPTELGNSGDIDFPLCQARVYVQQCGDISMVKALLKSWQAGSSEISPASLGMKPKAALFHVTAGMRLRSKHGT